MLLALLSLSAMAQEKRFNDLSLRPAPALSVNGPQGVSAPFAGTIGGKTVVAGGCNFPDQPAAEGGAKVFYQDIFRANDEPLDAATSPREELCFRGKIELVCLVNGRLGRSEDYDRAFERFITQ